MITSTGCQPDLVVDLAAGKLAAAQADDVGSHIAQCDQCAAQVDAAADLAAAWAMQREVDRQAAVLPDAVRSRMWDAIAAEVDAAATHAKQRSAWRTVASTRTWRAWAVAAGLALCAIGAWQIQQNAQQRPVPVVAAVQPSPRATPEFTQAKPNPLPEVPVVVPAVVAQPVPNAALPAELAASAAPAVRARGRAHPPTGALHLSCGAAVQVHGDGVTVVRDDPLDGLLRLNQGQVDVLVPKLPEGGRMAVQTEEAMILVKGTQFTVTRSDGSTKVAVIEGTVWVTPSGNGRPTEVLHPGQSTVVVPHKAWIKAARSALDSAIASKLWPEVVLQARRLIALLPPGREIDGLAMELAGAHAQLGEMDEAVAAAERVATHGVDALARENALVFVAGLHAKAHKPKAELALWLRYLAQFEDGSHAEQGLERAVELTCSESGEMAVQFRAKLAAKPSMQATALLRRCTPDPR